MSATPTYDNVVEELQIDPERIRARPAWSVQAAERRREAQQEVLRTASEPRVRQPRSRQSLTRQTHAEQSRPTQTAAAT
jgi:hypothetical protein